jgi:antitoxin CptB
MDEIETLRRRLRYQSAHRGTKELDILLGRFADAHLDTLDAAGLQIYATLLEVEETTLYGWLTGLEDVWPEYDTAIWRFVKEAASQAG